MNGNRQQKANLLARLPLFLLQVFRDFRRNQGMLLSGAIAYYSLLSIIPMLIITLIVLSQFIPEEQLYLTILNYLEMVMPGYAGTLAEQAHEFLIHRELVGIVVFLAMLFFSSIAFTVLENAMSVIFFHRVRIQRRHFLVSAVIPYLFISLLSLGILLVSFIAGALETLRHEKLIVLGLALRIGGLTGIILYVVGVLGELFMLTSFYLVMPVGGITFRNALIGGITATILWEVTRRLLVWYYSTLSLINLIYGSFATAVVILVSIEVAAIILLFGAQVIAELERRSDAGEAEGQPGFET